MNNYHQIHSSKYNKSNYQKNNVRNLETKYIQTNTVFYGTKSSPNAIIKNPLDGISYTMENNDPMTVGQHGKYFFRVSTSNTTNKEHNHLYYEDISDYLSHHNVILTDDNIARKWKIKRENYENMLDKVRDIGSVKISDCLYVFTHPPWTAK